ncbi:MAG: hypothetical protein NUW22_05135 [Acidobacteria bacterium]|nr:hypothetical protein [Acidobacteriota bacterium]
MPLDPRLHHVAIRPWPRCTPTGTPEVAVLVEHVDRPLNRVMPEGLYVTRTRAVVQAPRAFDTAFVYSGGTLPIIDFTPRKQEP